MEVTKKIERNLSSFQELKISPQSLAVLQQMKISQPTEIQSQAIPFALESRDIMGIAQTGTGKTLAFGLPTVENLAASSGSALILLPTRELAQQAYETFQKIARPYQLRTAMLIGGESIRKQVSALKQKPRIIIATPGRLIDLLKQQLVSLKNIQILVLDEADRMLDMGFAPQINQIFKTVPNKRQTMLFSATMPQEINQLARKYMKSPLRIEVTPEGTTAKDIQQELFIVNQEMKFLLLVNLLKQLDGSALVFSRTKYSAKKIAQTLRYLGHCSAEIHSNRSQGQRREAMEGFRSGKYRILVATDIAARGIDVSHIELVVNFDLPDNSADYVHRIGRTGRAGKKGRAISFATQAQRKDVKVIERLIKASLKISPLPELEKIEIPTRDQLSRSKSLKRDQVSKKRSKKKKSSSKRRTYRIKNKRSS